MKAEQAGEGQEQASELGQDPPQASADCWSQMGLVGPPPRWRGSGLSDMLPPHTQCPPHSPSLKLGENHKVTGGQPTSWDLL